MIRTTKKTLNPTTSDTEFYKPVWALYGAVLLCMLGCQPQSGAASGQSEGKWRSDYQVYEPDIQRTFIYNPEKGELKYNHDASIAYFKGHFIAAWNANTDVWEGKKGQLNYWAHSKDGQNWSEPIPFGPTRPFGNPNWQTEWQPNLFVFSEDELWCTWTKSGAFIHSVLRDIEKGWEHRVVHEEIVVDGEAHHMFPSQDPVRLADGSVIAPLVLRHPIGTSAQNTAAAPMRTRDGGKTWEIPPGSVVRHPDFKPGGLLGIWEPMYFVQADGRVRMFARNEDRTAPANELLLTSVGTPDAEHFGPAERSEIETIISRMWVGRAHDRWLMLHHDTHGMFFAFDRINIALFVSPDGTDNFLPGIPIVDDEKSISYPQATLVDGKLHIIYTSGAAPRAIKMASVDPLPQPGISYVYPRSHRRSIAGLEKPRILDGPPAEIEFYGRHHLESTAVNSIGKQAITFTGWVRTHPQGHGLLLNALSPDSKSGFAIRSGWMDRMILIFGSQRVELRDWKVPQDNAYQFIAVVLDPATREILFWKNNRLVRAAAKLPENVKLGAEPIRFGTANDYSSAQTLANPFYGGIHRAELFTGKLDDNQIRAIHNAGASSLNLKVASGTTSTPPTPLAELNIETISDPAAFIQNDLPLASAVKTENGKLRILGNASAAVETDPFDPAIDTLEVQFSVRMDQVPASSGFCLLTLGGREPVRIILPNESPGYIQLERDGEMIRTPVPFKFGADNNIHIAFRPDGIHLAHNGIEHEIAAAVTGRRLFLGDAMPRAFADPADVATFDLSHLRTRVIHSHTKK